MREEAVDNSQEFLIRQYDASVKRVLANKKILAWILKEGPNSYKATF